jgi:GT2 family glycosyltransferase
MQLLKSEFFDYNPFNKPLKINEYTNKESEFLKIDNNNINKFASTGNLTLIQNDDNYGYAKGNNIGIKYAFKLMNPDYVLILNNDTVMDKNFLVELVKYAETSPAIGIIGPKIFIMISQAHTSRIH